MVINVIGGCNKWMKLVTVVINSLSETGSEQTLFPDYLPSQSCITICLSVIEVWRTRATSRGSPENTLAASLAGGEAKRSVVFNPSRSSGGINPAHRPISAMNQNRVAELAPGYPWNVPMASTTASITSPRRNCSASRPLWRKVPGRLFFL